MTSLLAIHSDDLNEAFLAKHLQVKGEKVGEHWCFPMPGRLKDRPASRHLRHWVAFLHKHAVGRRALQKAGHKFSLRLRAESDGIIEFTPSEIEELARLHCGLTIEREA